MKGFIKELESEYLERKPFDRQKQEYDLVNPSYINRPINNYGTYLVTRREECRIDLVSQKLYNNTNMDHFLCKVNQIYNPLKIKTGQVLLWTPPAVMKNTVIAQEEITDVRLNLIEANKATRFDPRRNEFLSTLKDNALPPVIDDANARQTTIDGDVIRITPNLVRDTFSPPSPPIVTPVSTQASNANKSPASSSNTDIIVFVPNITRAGDASKPKTRSNTSELTNSVQIQRSIIDNLDKLKNI
jgi:hypothetical protein